MKALRLAACAAVAGVGLVSGCSSCGNGGLFSRMGLRPRGECCVVPDAGVPVGPGLPCHGDGPFLGDPGPGVPGPMVPGPTVLPPPTGPIPQTTAPPLAPVPPGNGGTPLATPTPAGPASRAKGH